MCLCVCGGVMERGREIKGKNRTSSFSANDHFLNGMNEPNFQCPKTIQRWSTSSLLSFSLLSFTHKYPYKHNGSQVIAHIFLTHTHTLSNTPTHSLKHTHTHIHSPTHTSIFLALTTLTCCCFYFTLPSTAQALPPLQERSFCYEVTHVPVSLWSISLEESFQSSQSRNRRWEVLSLSLF